MSERIHALAQQLSGKASVEECSLQEAEELATSYPYFAPAQFLLLQKLKQEGLPGYNTQLQKAVLFYHNPLEFEYFINSEKFYTELPYGEKIADTYETQSGITSESQLPQSETEIFQEVVTDVSEEDTPSTHFPEDKSLEIPEQEIHSVPESEAQSRQLENELLPEIKDEEIQPVHFPEDKSLEIPEQEIHSVPESVEDPVEILHESSATKEETEPAHLPEQTEANQENGINPDEEQTEPSQDVPLPSLRLEAILSQAETQNSKSNILFEPYHTVDYFESQGIKSMQEEVPQDKFGKQLKSFTQWLKSMKRLPVMEIQKTIDPATEVKLVNMANDSVHEANVVTEAMAEVWLKQGNIEKAIEIYNKLSLQDPSKRAFFAGKIENLKHP